MSHILHISKNKQNLEIRFAIIRLMREFFWSQGFTEVETPLILRLPGQEPNLSPMKISVHDENGKTFDGFMHTSPEYAMKKMMTCGFDNIFSVCKCFRDYESFGGTHNPEFTMVEWYRAHKDFYALMDDTEQMVKYIVEGLKKLNILRPIGGSTVEAERLKDYKIGDFRRMHMRDVWKEYVGVNLDDYLELEPMKKLCVERGYDFKEDVHYEDFYYRIFMNDIEPHLGMDAPTFVHHFPTCMASLSKISTEDPRYAERFEIYIDGIELANAFTELTNADEQKDRLLHERAQRKEMGRDVFDIDEEFIDALRAGMPDSTGIALGVDRLVQILTGCKNINDVLVLPMEKLFSS